METIRILCIALVLSACGTTKSEGPRRYRAWCTTDYRPVGDWHDTKEEAEADRQAHKRMWGWHEVRIEIAG